MPALDGDGNYCDINDAEGSVGDRGDYDERLNAGDGDRTDAARMAFGWTRSFPCAGAEQRTADGDERGTGE